LKALVLETANTSPKFTDFEEPQVKDDSQRVVKLLAAALNPYDYYLSSQAGSVLPRIVGGEGVGQLEDGRRVYFDSSVSPYGSVAEQALILGESGIQLPEDLDLGQALISGTAGLAGYLPLAWKAEVRHGESVLILGATGVQGQVATQVAKLLGASHVTAAGRNQQVLEELTHKGADSIAVLGDDPVKAIKQAMPEGGYQVVIDSLFGEPLLAVLNSGCLSATSRVVVVGGSAAQEINLGFRQLQSIKGASISGYSTFFVPSDVKQAAYLKLVGYLKTGDIQVAVSKFELDQAEQAWQAQAEGPHAKVIITM
jgi:NADPH:quinone reductase-like Zn-dependent oxidoreductase